MTRPRAWARPVAALAAGLGALLAPATLAPTTSAASPVTLPASTSEPEERPTAEPGTATELDVEITEMPAILRPDQPLTVRGTVDNDTDQDVATPVVRLRIQRSTPVSRSALARWMDPGSLSTTVVVAREELPAALPAGTTATFAVEVDPEVLPLARTHTAWGPRGIEATVHDGSGVATVTGADRSVLVWDAGVELTPMPVGVLVPVTPSADERIRARADGVSVAAAAGPRLLDLVTAVDQPGVTLAVDAMLLSGGADPAPEDTGGPEDPAPAEPGGEGTAPAGEETQAAEEATAPDEGTIPADEGTTPAGSPTSGATTPAQKATEPTTDGTAPPQDGAEPTGDATAPPQEGDETAGDPAPRAQGGGLAEALVTRSRAPDREVTVLPWADADVAALAHTDRLDLLTWASDRAGTVADEAGLRAGPQLAWPATREPDHDTVVAATANGAAAVVLEGSALPPTAELTYTPSGRTDLVVDEDARMPALLVDDRASAILTGVLPAIREDDDPRPLSALDARQMLLGETAVIARERPNDPRAVVLALPRDVSGDLADVAESLEVLLGAPWVDPSVASELVAAEAPGTARGDLPEQEITAAEVDGRLLSLMDQIAADAAAFAAITPEPELIVTPVTEALAPALSASWRADPGARTDLVAQVAADVAALRTQVTTATSSTLNLINSSAQIPVTVQNDLDVDVTVRVRLEPGDQRLRAAAPVELVVPASSRATAQVPVRAVGSGDVRVGVALLGPDGTEVGAATDLQVRVRADWENVGTAVVAGLLGIMLVVGLVRTVRRGPRVRPTAEEEP